MKAGLKMPKRFLISLLLLIVFSISSGFEVFRSLSGDVLMDVFYREDCQKFQNTEFIDGDCICKEKNSTFHVFNNKFGCYDINQWIDDCTIYAEQSSHQKHEPFPTIESAESPRNAGLLVPGIPGVNPACNITGEKLIGSDWSRVNANFSYDNELLIVYQLKVQPFDDVRGEILRLSFSCSNYSCMLMKGSENTTYDIPESLKPKENETLYELKDPDSSGEGGEDENGNDFLFNNDTDIWPLPEESTDSTPSYIMTTTVSTPVPHDHQHDRFPLSVGFCVTGLLLVIAVVITYTICRKKKPKEIKVISNQFAG